MILLRATAVDDQVERVADELAAASGERVVIVVDGRRGGSRPSRFETIAVSAPRLSALGLFAGDDVAWRCGDYAAYLARDLHPEEPHFWIIEPDVRILGPAADFFSACASHRADILAGRTGPASPHWAWNASVQARGVAPRALFFATVRLSADAVDSLLAKRREQSRRPARRRLWPNDEAFVATHAAVAGLVVADFKDVGDFYDDRTFSYDNVRRPEELPAPGPTPKLHHPVLDGEAYDRKLARGVHTRRSLVLVRLRARLWAWVNSLTSW